jgi:hypothetical protein
VGEAAVVENRDEGRVEQIGHQEDGGADQNVHGLFLLETDGANGRVSTG